MNAHATFGAACVAAWLMASPAHAVSDAPLESTKCTQFKLAAPDWLTCMRSAISIMSDDDLYFAAYKLETATHYDEAILFLQAAKNQGDVRILSNLGYANRKLGRIEEGIAFYLKALAADPNSVTTREYLGEGYLDKRDLAGAESQLVEIERRCGRSCESYTLLSAAIAKYKAV